MKSKIQLTMLEIVLLVFGAASGFLFLFFKADLPLLVRVYLKIIPITLMCVWILSRRIDKYNWPIFVGLIFAILGDATLEVGGQYLFIVGIIFNVLALIFYTIYFIKSDRSLDIFRLIPPLLVIGTIYFLIFPSLGQYSIFVGIYCVVYVLFLWRSSARIGDKTISVASQWVCFVGCVIITVSDALLSIQIFKPTPHWYTNPFLSMFLWWTGQLMMTITAEIKEKKRRAV